MIQVDLFRGQKELRFSIFFCGCKQSKSLHIYNYSANVQNFDYFSAIFAIFNPKNTYFIPNMPI